MKRFTRVKCTDEAANKNFQSVEASLNSAIANPLISGQYLPQVALTANTPKTIQHGLGVAYTDILLCVPTVACTVIQGTSPDRTQFVILTASADTQLGLFIF